MPAEPAIEDTRTYCISANHGVTAHVGHWNGRALLQLRAKTQDKAGGVRHVLVALDQWEVNRLSQEIREAERLCHLHQARTNQAPGRLLYKRLSREETGRLRHLEVSRWQGYVKASVRRYFYNDQKQLQATKDGIQYNADQITTLRRLLPLISRDFEVASRRAAQMTAHEQETLALIDAMELEEAQRGVDEPDSGHGPSMASDSDDTAILALASVPAAPEASPTPGTSTGTVTTPTKLKRQRGSKAKSSPPKKGKSNKSSKGTIVAVTPVASEGAPVPRDPRGRRPALNTRPQSLVVVESSSSEDEEYGQTLPQE